MSAGTLNDAVRANGNPLAERDVEQQQPQACTLVIFGGGGDLSRRKLLPAIYNQGLDGELPASFALLGFALEDLNDDSFRDFAKGGIERYSRRPVDPDYWPDFARLVHYEQGSFDDAQAYERLKARLDEIDAHFGIPGNRIFYLAIPPALIGTCVSHLKQAGLVNPADGISPFTRVIVEKPIGRDLESARKINATLSENLDESQIYRIDHYLGKETVQNILVLRFGNAIFEPLWNARYIDHVQITVAEEEGVGTRAGYYDKAGALRDMVQNHILQLLTLIAMEPPWSMDADVIRNHRQDVLNCLRRIDRATVDQHLVRAQYGPGFVRGEDVPGYRREENISSDSTTETYVALKVFVDNWRWSGVPFYIRTGKRMPKRASEIAIHFKPIPPILFNSNPDQTLEPNVLTLNIQPNEGLSMRIATKLPGSKVRIYPVKMDFRYGSTFGEQSPEAYERLLLDVMAGDATLFMRRDAVEASWIWVQDIFDAWAETRTRWLPEYPAGTWGPLDADRLIETDGRRWRLL
ncbi:glucose-6-phosphate dehydrogenase [Methylococcus sp. EFPC2]|uniref:glucose-6-phosphate dehydrogenase n=1 Tax=Methylococcus sp. EFPC2 TaxID=2812648 RepID=UPI0019678FD6|nr:glucose-6-phosphate dehydrogenase [Methylococcus sp. EFPC2]QSA98568.1 glucose-6-phosphate dehydrogenase [Methylococcus sp. EFPC2]